MQASLKRCYDLEAQLYVYTVLTPETVAPRCETLWYCCWVWLPVKLNLRCQLHVSVPLYSHAWRVVGSDKLDVETLIIITFMRSRITDSKWHSFTVMYSLYSMLAYTSLNQLRPIAYTILCRTMNSKNNLTLPIVTSSCELILENIGEFLPILTWPK